MKNTIRAVWPVVLVVALVLPILAFGQVLTRDGDPVMSVTDPAKATPTGRQKGKTPPLAAGQQVLLVAAKDGMATVSVDNPKATGMFDEYYYQLPMTALRSLPGKTKLERPAWLPSPAPAGTEARDVVAYTLNEALVVRSGQAKPRNVVRGHVVQESYALSPDGALLAYSPEEGAEIVFLPLDGKAKPWHAGADKGQTRRATCSPDGSKLAWRAGEDILVLDWREPGAKPRTVLRELAPEAELQGFTSNSDALVIADGEAVSWWGLDGKKRRSLPPDTFTNEGAALGPAQYLPSPVEADLMLVAGQTRGTEAYHKWANDVSGAIYLYDAASGSNYRLTPKNLAASNPAWSPDGKRIYFCALPDTPPNGPHHIYRINADGSGLSDLGPGFAPRVGTRPE